jgi:formylmethanofuran dehydrogenase subunit C
VSPLTFTLKKGLADRIDASALTPHRLAGLSPDEVKALYLPAGNARVAVGEVFAVRGRDARHLRFAGDTAWLDLLGHEMTEGSITVEGDAGVQAGRRMTGGTLSIGGHAGPWAGSQMAGGRIDIAGGAGDRLGGPLPGEMHGMAGGIITVASRTGDRAGERMRRGLIVVRHDAGDHAGYRMIAGTLLVLGKAGMLPGTLMGRGTIVIGKGAEAFSPTFVDCGVQELAFLGLLAKSLAADGIATGTLFRKPLRRLAGDLAALGKGEIFTPL